jgi:hypothetical protein
MVQQSPDLVLQTAARPHQMQHYTLDHQDSTRWCDYERRGHQNRHRQSVKVGKP